jgi:hypothetical protein
MAGVAGPMRSRSRADAARFLIGLTVGGVAAGLLLAVPVYLAGYVAGQLLPASVRAGLLIAVAVGLGVADLLGRTPHVWRQVPQKLVRELPPGTLGLTWGFYLGLLVTTQKASSLLWVSIAAVVLLDPGLAPVALVAFSLVATAGIVALTMTVWSIVMRGGLGWEWIRRARWVTGATMLAAGVGAALVWTV